MLTHAYQATTVYANQGLREATVLAILGDHALVEYEMPNGSTALRVVLCADPEVTVQRFSYARTPVRWLKELIAEDVEWICARQQGGGLITVRDLYEQHIQKGNSHATI